jgi:cytochrome d ubiquinol oxidase subunit II
MKTEGPLQENMQRRAKPLLLVFLLVTAIISLWTPLTHSAIADRWFTMPNILWFLPVPVLVVLVSIWMLRAVNRKSHHAPFLLTLALVFLGYSGLGISIWPNIVPPSITFWQAAAPPQSLDFMLVGALVIIPIILVYTFWSYYVFRGKVTPDQGYH